MIILIYELVFISAHFESHLLVILPFYLHISLEYYNVHKVTDIAASMTNSLTI